MLVGLLQVTVLLTVLGTLGVDAQSCQSGWFGRDCMFMCHCKKSETCEYTGACPRHESCADNQFGPGCQFEDLASKYGDTKKDDGIVTTYMIDHDENTCNYHTDATFVKISLKTPSRFSWIRLFSEDKYTVSDFTLKLNGHELCSNEKRFRIAENWMDVWCDKNILLETLELEGTIAPNICSIYISGGRNVALKQQVNQSSERGSERRYNAAFHAVDGNTDQYYENGHCSCTEHENKPQVYLGFNYPQMLLRATLLNRDGNQFRLKRFIFETLDAHKNVISLYNAPDRDQNLYDVPTLPRVPISQIRITGVRNVNHELPMLTICEIVIFGDTLCPDGKYGLFCDKTCTCSSDQTCNSLTGSCAQGCPAGFYGYNCLLRCSERCLDNLCMERFGTCLACPAGYTGQFCEKDCPRGTYGERCEMPCSSHCANVCDHRYGNCTCQSGVTGLLCTECPKGYWGTKCTSKCSPLCFDARCHIDTSLCFFCVGKRLGSKCEDCPDKYYGPLCSTQCSQFCFNGTCDKVTGNCPACTEGYSGPQCRFSPLLYMLLNIVLPSVLVFFLVVGVCFFLLKKRSQRLSERE